MKPAPQRARSSRGFTLIEVLIALVILAFGMLSVAGVLGRSTQTELEAHQRSQAMTIAAEMVDRITNNPKQAAQYVANYAPTGAAEDCTALCRVRSNDRFYTLLDRSTAKGDPGALAINEGQLTVNGGTFYAAAGCYLPLNSTAGEKVVTSAVSTGGYTYFSTNTPTSPFSTNSCNTQMGIAKSYRVALFCGQAESQEFVGGGLPPSPVIGFVEVQVPASGGSGEQGEETKQVPFIIGGFNAQLSGLQASRVPINVDPTRRRTYWFTNKVR